MRIVFAAPHCLLDPTSGAAQSCLVILERLAERGHSAVALQATTFDRPGFATPEAFFQSVGARLRLLEAAPGRMIAAGYLQSRGVEHVIMRTDAQTRLALTALEEEAFWLMLVKYLDELRPDVVMVYGGRLGDLARYRKLRDRGMPVIFYLVNAHYRSPETFLDVALVLTDSEATADLYKRRLGLDVVPTGMFVRPFAPSPVGQRDCCTFINPEPAKGVALFAAIAAEAQRRHLATRFLVVESRARLASSLERLGLGPGQLANVSVVPKQSDMTEIWARTKILLVPSLWHESGPRVVAEALSALIPTLAIRSGGSEQMLNGGGDLFPNPLDAAAIERGDFTRPFGADVFGPWVDRIAALWSDDAAYAAAMQRARLAWATHPSRDDVGHVERVLLRAIELNR
jgi:glycosyltransferase involved in cell wall biosynthesis